MGIHNCRAVLAALLMASMYIRESRGESAHYQVIITNRLGHEEMNNVMCTYKSPLGVYSIGDGKDVMWELQINDDEPFTCTFYWQNKSVDGPLFVQSKQGEKCKLNNNKCQWELRPDGVYFLGDAKGPAERVMVWHE